MKKQFAASAALVALALLLCASASWSAVGIYKWSAGATVPSTISYTLNVDANDPGGAAPDDWSVKVEIVPAAGGAAVKTYKFVHPDSHCLKGTRSVVWDGTNGAGGYAASGDYVAVITARRAAVTGTDLRMVFEDGTNSAGNYYTVAVNKNPGSPYFGRIYAVIKWVGIRVYEPDGTVVGTYSGGLGWGSSSAPWGLAIDASDNVWVTSRSNVYWNQIFCFTPYQMSGGVRVEGLEKIYGPIKFATSERACDVYGPTNDVKALVTTYSNAITAANAMGRLMTASGNPSSWTDTTFKDWQTPTGAGGLAFCQPRLFEEAGSVKALVPARVSSDGSTLGNGGLAKYSIDWASGVATQEWINSNLTLPMAVDISPDGSKVWISRNATQSDTSKPFWVVNSSIAQTATSADATQYGFTGTAASLKRIQFFRMDAVGNIVCTYGATNSEGWQNWVGLYEPPDSGSSNTRTTSAATPIRWGGDHSPVYEGDNGPVVISSCAAGASGSVEAYVSDEDGYLEVWRDAQNQHAGCFLDRSAFGQSVIPMNPVSHGVNNATYQLDISVPSGTAPGDYELPVYVRERHYPMVDQVVGYVTIRVTGGWITGTVTNSVTGWPVEGATVTATSSTNPEIAYSVLTDADGNYAISAAPGGYTVDASKGTGYAASPDPATAVTVACSSTATANRTLGPITIRTCTDGNATNIPGRAIGEKVCVTGIVSRTHFVQDVQNGLSGHYYIYDTKYAGTMSGCKILVYSGQQTLREGDEVVVEGTWDKNYGYFQGFVRPSRAPHVVSTGKSPGTPTAFLMTYINYAYGRLYKASGVAVEVNTTAGRFSLQMADGKIGIRPMTLSSTGITLPAENQLVDVIGVLAMEDSFGANVLVPGKPSDVFQWPTVYGLGDAKKLGDGGVMIKLDDPAHPAEPLVVTYVDPGETGGDGRTFFWVESADRTAGLRVASGAHTPGELMPGDDVLYLKGTLATVAGFGRVLNLLEPPTVGYHYGDLSRIPAFLFSNVKTFGGGALGGTPGVIQGAGANTDGLLMRVTGISSGYGSNDNYEWFYLDDGSGVPNEGGHTGIKVIRSLYVQDPMVWFPTEDGTLLTVEGICSSQWVNNVGRIRVLWMRYDPYLYGLSDQIIYR